MSKYEELQKKLLLKKRSCWEVWDEAIRKKSFQFAEGYKLFLNAAKTEHEAVREGVKLAKKMGFKDISQAKKLKAGDKVYAVNRGKALYLARIGKDLGKRGLRILMSHIDSPHLDFKVTPLYEDENLAFLKTNYYAGIKKYQWPTIALALHGTVYLADGKSVEIVIGEKDSDPIFMITDLLPHLDRATGPGGAAKSREVEGEDLNLLVGSIPVRDDKVKEKVKLAVLEYLNKEYGMIEADLASAELMAVPSEKARDLGFDRSLISAYGHDDKICAYTSLMSLLDSKNNDDTQVCVWIDREEIGSEGNTGAQSIFFETFISDLLEAGGCSDDLEDVYRLFGKSTLISTDVTAAVDPDYKEVHDLRNSARMGNGLVVEKYTSTRGKYDSSEASGELMQRIRRIFDNDKNVVYQLCGGAGKVDRGGGGTIAKYMANRNMEVVDMGVALFNMHAPLEIASKADLYAAYLGYKAFLED